MASAKDLWTTMTSGDVPASPASVQSLLDLGMGGIPALDQQSRSTLTRKLLADISSKPENRMTYLKALKELSRLPGGSNAQAEVQGLRTLLEQVRLPAPSVYRRHSASAGPSSSSSASHGGVTSSPTSITGVLSRAWHSKKSNGTSVRRPSTESGAKPGISGRQPSSENEGSRTSRETATPSPIAPNGGPISTSHPQQYQPPRPPSAEEWEATDIALRCLNNALFLHESSRRTFTDDSVGGGARRLVGLLKNPAQTPTDVLFLAGRLLFYATLFEPKFNKIVVEEEGIVQDLCEALAVLTAPQLVNGIGTAPTQDQMKAAQSELLKVIFNVSLYYSTSQDGEAASGSKADVAQEPLLDLLEPVIRLIISYPASPPLAAPVSGAIGVLLNLPLTQPYYSVWTREFFPTRRGSAPPPSPTPSSSSSFTKSSTSAARRVANALFSSGSTGAEQHEGSSSSPQTPTHPSSTATASASAGTLIEQLLSLLDATLDYYFGMSSAHSRKDSASSMREEAGQVKLDPDSAEVRAKAAKDGLNLEELLSPLFLLLRKLAAADVPAGTTNEASSAVTPSTPPMRRAVQSNLFSPSSSPASSLPPYRQPTTVGHLVRLLSSLRFPRLEALSGELLLAACGGDARALVKEVGYGPCAGWLQRSGRGGEGLADLAGEEGPSGEQRKDPITGAPFSSSGSAPGQADGLDEMTEEEKEAEAERLFTLFDRLNKTGVMKVAHPVRDAKEGLKGDAEAAVKFEELRSKDEEDKEEEQTMREFAQYKERKGKVAEDS